VSPAFHLYGFFARGDDEVGALWIEARNAGGPGIKGARLDLRLDRRPAPLSPDHEIDFLPLLSLQ
jgi:hypothetical protein